MAKYREVEPLKKGDRVVMHTCIEARNPKNYGKVWTCKVDEYEQGEGVYHQSLIFLDGFSGSFMTKYLQKVNDEALEELEWANNERRISENLWKESFCGLIKEKQMSSHNHAIYAGELRKEIKDLKEENERLKMLNKDCEGVSNQLYKQVRELSEAKHD